MLNRLLDLVAPPALGRDFRRLVSSSWVSNLGDGIGLAAGPLLIASETSDPFLVSLAMLLRGLPWLLFGLVAGAVADRVDRRRLVVGVDVVRTAVLAVLLASIVTGTLSIAVVLGSILLVSTAEVFADTSSQTLLPMLVEREHLPLGNARLAMGTVGVNSLVGPPVGAALFAAGRAWPVLSQALLVLAGALLLRTITASTVPAGAAPSRLRAEVAEGFRWSMQHAAVRTLIITIFLFNITYGAAWSVLVLWAHERLGLQEVGFGALLAVTALGSVVGGAVYGRVTRRVSLSWLMRAGLVFETVTHLLCAVTTTAWFAFLVMFVFGVHAMVWGTTSTSIRQLSVPEPLQGRVNGVNLVATFGSTVLGSALGGLLAQRAGVTAPFWFGFGGSALLVVVLWRQLGHVEHD